jgi:hypothetical protein
VLKTLYKGRRYETKLRELDELCGKAYQQALEKLHKIHCHYSRPSIVLELEEEEFCYAGSCSPPRSIVAHALDSHLTDVRATHMSTTTFQSRHRRC